MNSSAQPTSTRQRRFAIATTVVVLSTLFSLALCEVLLRVALFSEGLRVPALRQAWRYSDSAYEENYWKLSYLFEEGDNAPRVGRVHPTLGWMPATTTANPLGMHAEHPVVIEELERPILFYGDSFVAGVAPLELPERLPQLLDTLTGDRRVINLGVGGFGLDQVYLRFRDSASAFRNPTVLIGILMDDLDRTVLSFRAGLKPYFEIEGQELVVRNVPITQTPLEFVAEHPPQIRSYLWRLVLMRVRKIWPHGWADAWLGYDDLDQRKRLICTRLLEQFVEDARAQHIQIYFVLLYGPQELGYQSWQEQFLKAELARLDRPYFDTKSYLAELRSTSNIDPTSLYLAEQGHLSAVGNLAIARGIARWLQKREEL